MPSHNHVICSACLWPEVCAGQLDLKRLAQHRITFQIHHLHHSHFKYSMNWECPACHLPSSINLCLCSGAFHIWRSRERSVSGNSRVESCSVLFKASLKHTIIVLFTCCVLCLICGSVVPHTPLLSFSLLLFYLQCISVRKRLGTSHGSERQRKTVVLCAVAPRPCD